MYSEPEILLARPRAAARQCCRIAYIPHEDMGNAYTERMRELLTEFGVVEPFAGIKSLLRQLPRSLRRYDVVVVNWLESAIIASDTGRISPRGTARLFLKTMLMKAFSRRMVFVRHNNYPHETAPGSEGAARRLIDFYEALFHRVITHSGAAADGDRQYCPHPLYQRATDTPASLTGMALPNEYFLAFGRILPYKKLDALIENFPPGRMLIVAGSVGDADYAERLAQMRRDNFIFLPGRLEEAEAQRLVSGARGVVIANAEQDMVVSGTFFYAMSLGCPVFAVATPFLTWARERIGDELLVLGANLKRLCRAIATSDTRPVSEASREAVVREFGDASISKALAAALERNP